MADWTDESELERHLKPLLEQHEVKWRGHGVIYVDHQNDNLTTAQAIVAQLSRTFNVPAAHVWDRLVEVRLLNDVRASEPMDEVTAQIIEAPSRAWSDDHQDHDGDGDGMHDEYPDA